MRFRRIEIPAYGPFTNFAAEFAKGAGDFHLVYGPNEAGKSSLLRAMRALLFGIHGQTTDNFLHDYRQLRILAELEDTSGAAKVFQRRKGYKDTLLNQAGTAIPESELRSMLGAVDEGYFNSLFGLGSEELRHGADELLRGQGRLGEALFSASLGGTPVDRVIQALEEEAGAIFSGRAQRRIREAARKFSDHQQGKKDHLIKPEAWEEVERGLGEQLARLELLTSNRRERIARKEWLERCRGALPIVGQLAERHRQIEELKDLPDLPRSFASQIREAQSAWQAAAKEVEQLERERTRLSMKLDSCALRPAILDMATVIDRLHTHLGTYRENQRGVVARHGEASAKEQSVQSKCRDLGITNPLDQLEPLRVTLPQVNEADQMARRVTATSKALSDGERKIQERESELERLRAEPAEGDATELKELSELIHRAAAVETTANGLSARSAALDGLDRTLRSLHRNLTGAPADLEATRNLPVPARSRIEQFREQIEENRREAKSLGDDKRKAEETIRRIEAEIERLARQREVPSLADLESMRRHRDYGWALVLQAWKGGGKEETLAEGKSLAEAYPEAVVSADKIADRLRLEAETVAQLEEQRTKLKLEVATRDDLEARLAAAQNTGKELSETWRAAWKDCHPEPASPGEMIEWRETWQEFGRQWDQWSKDLGQIATDRKRVNELASALSKAIGSDSSDFGEVLARVRERRDELDAARDNDSARAARIADLEKDLKSARESLPDLLEEHRSARAGWERCCESLQLSSSGNPVAEVEALRLRREMFQEYDQWQIMLKQTQGLQENVDRFEEEVRTLATSLGVGGGSAELQEAALWSALEEAKKAKTEHDGFEEQILDVARRLDGARTELESERERFEKMLLQTGLENAATLEIFLSRLEDLWGHRETVGDLRVNLAGLAQTESVEAFVERVQKEDGTGLQSEIEGLIEEVEQIDRDIEVARASRQEWEGQRTGMENAQDAAARHEQEAAFAASAMLADAERFVRLRVAVALLRGQIDTFRRQNQGPFMEKASRWFAEITGGSFRGIGTSYRNGDEPVIAGLRGDPSHPEEVLVPGMSEGTRDQLYLALRFAGLELHLQDHEPMPMILDDLLVHFDDERATNALKALSQLGQRSQVFLFTHHAHVVELARAGLGQEGFQLVRIA